MDGVVRAPSAFSILWGCPLHDGDARVRRAEVNSDTGKPWPPIPSVLLKIWDKVADYPHPPEACLVNFYEGSARMGLHQDRDEDDFDAPVVSVSLGDTAVFRVGGLQRKSPTRSFKLASGDVVVLGGAARLCHHGIDRVLPGTSAILKDGGRINLTLRRVTKPQP
jgi:alkylated DNA repair protein (DNA oxidative demethylase)